MSLSDASPRAPLKGGDVAVTFSGLLNYGRGRCTSKCHLTCAHPRQPATAATVVLIRGAGHRCVRSVCFWLQRWIASLTSIPSEQHNSLGPLASAAPPPVPGPNLAQRRLSEVPERILLYARQVKQDAAPLHHARLGVWEESRVDTRHHHKIRCVCVMAVPKIIAALNNFLALHLPLSPGRTDSCCLHSFSSIP